MRLSHGGHLTHGHPINMSGKWFRIVDYGVNEHTGRIDYDEVRSIAKRECPRMIVAGASAYPRIIDFEAFASIAQEVGAYLMVDMAHIAGLVAAGSIRIRCQWPTLSPVPRTKLYVDQGAG